MTDERHKSSGARESVARPTARDVPNVRTDLLSETAPQAQRPAQLPRDPSYEAELAQVDLAVLRDPDRRDPSTKQAGGRGHQLVAGQPPESVTPESPGARPRPPVAVGQSPEPPSSVARSVASGTLLSVGAVDPRGKTERTLETPRMFFSQGSGAEAYFKPGKIPAVTVHQTLETETVKLSDSVDPRRAKTLPRIDRAQFAQHADAGEAQSAAPMVLTGPGSAADSAAPEAERWDDAALAADPTSLPSAYDGQIHASLSQFRDQAEPSYSLDDAPTRAEPVAGRRALQLPELELAGPDPSTVPTHRDLPQHRIEASEPPPPPLGAARPSGSAGDAGEPESEGPRPTTASIAADEPERRAVWINYAAFVAALLVAIVVGLFLTREREPEPVRGPQPREATRTELPLPAPAPAPLPSPPVDAPAAKPAVAPAAPTPPVAAPAKKTSTSPAAAPDASPKPAPKPARETIF